MIITTADKDTEQLEFIHTGGNINFGSLAVSYSSLIFTCHVAQQSHSRYLPKRCENIKDPYKDVCPGVHRILFIMAKN